MGEVIKRMLIWAVGIPSASHIIWLSFHFFDLARNCAAFLFWYFPVAILASSARFCFCGFRCPGQDFRSGPFCPRPRQERKNAIIIPVAAGGNWQCNCIENCACKCNFALQSAWDVPGRNQKDEKLTVVRVRAFWSRPISLVAWWLYPQDPGQNATVSNLIIKKHRCWSGRTSCVSNSICLLDVTLSENGIELFMLKFAIWAWLSSQMTECLQVVWDISRRAQSAHLDADLSWVSGLIDSGRGTHKLESNRVPERLKWIGCPGMETKATFQLQLAAELLVVANRKYDKEVHFPFCVSSDKRIPVASFMHRRQVIELLIVHLNRRKSPAGEAFRNLENNPETFGQQSINQRAIESGFNWNRPKINQPHAMKLKKKKKRTCDKGPKWNW